MTECKTCGDTGELVIPKTKKPCPDCKVPARQCKPTEPSVDVEILLRNICADWNGTSTAWNSLADRVRRLATERDDFEWKFKESHSRWQIWKKRAGGDNVYQ